MANAWRFIPVVSSAFMVVAWSVFLLGALESSEQRAANHLGFPGPTARVIAAPNAGYQGPEPLTAALDDYAAEHEVSIAYSQSYATGVVSLLDEYDRFRNSEGSLASLLDGSKSGSTAALSTALGGSTSDFAERHLPIDAALTGTFRSDVRFENQYPDVVLTADALPFDTGVYLFAGDSLADGDTAVQQIVRVFENNGLAVMDATRTAGNSVARMIVAGFAGPYGVVILLFGGIVALGQLMVTLIHAALHRERLFVAGVLGAAKGNLRKMVFHRLLRLAVPGLGAGAVLSLLIVLSSQRLSLAALGPRALAVLVALGMSGVASVVIFECVAWREARKVGRAIPC